MKGRKHKAAGGAEHGKREYEEDLATKNQRDWKSTRLNSSHT